VELLGRFRGEERKACRRKRPDCCRVPCVVVILIGGAEAEAVTRAVVEMFSNEDALFLGRRSKQVPRGRYWRSRPLVFSFVARSHAWCGSWT
jgi:hypothetical protein